MKWMFSPKFVAGAAVGYLFGTRAGREQYDRIMARVDTTKGQVLEQAREHGSEVIDKARDRGAEVVEKVKEHSPFGPDSEAHPATDRTSPHPRPAESVLANGRPGYGSGRE
jgi:hypothetical protein